MNRSQLSEMVGFVRQVCSTRGNYESHSPGLHLFVEGRPGVPPPAVLNPSICLTVQGTKQVFLGDRHFEYGSAEFLLASIDLPLMGRITEATSDKPFIGLKIDIDPKRLSALLMRMDNAPLPTRSSEKGLRVCQADVALGDAFVRLVGLLEQPADIPVLHELILDEIYYRILTGPYGYSLAQMVLDGSRIQRISGALTRLKRDFTQRISVDELASASGMSISSFHSHFKSATDMSPLQYQKSLRLIEARRLMLAEGQDAAKTSYAVGYDSPSQFNREYARMFGKPPGRDVEQMKSSLKKLRRT